MMWPRVASPVRGQRVDVVHPLNGAERVAALVLEHAKGCLADDPGLEIVGRRRGGRGLGGCRVICVQAVDRLEIGQPCLMARPGDVVDAGQLQGAAILRNALHGFLVASGHPQPNLGFAFL